jgi:hypothetical protein
MNNALPSVSSSGGVETSIRRLSVGDAEPQNDLTLSPGLRRTQQLVDITFVEEVRTTQYGGSASPIRSLTISGEDYSDVTDESVDVDDSTSIVLST